MGVVLGFGCGVAALLLNFPSPLQLGISSHHETLIHEC